MKFLQLESKTFAMKNDMEMENDVKLNWKPKITLWNGSFRQKKDAIYLHLTQCNQLHGSHEFISYFFFFTYFAG